jgi:uncharacterized heparinase superfamily protein
VAVRHALLLARTVRHLRPSQVVHRVRLRAQRVVVARTSSPARRLLALAIRNHAAGWPLGFLPVDARASAQWPGFDLLAAGRVRVLGRESPTGEWVQPDAPQLWRYHLHYWDWAWPLVLAPDAGAARTVFAGLFESWRGSTAFGRGDAWSPYVVSLRAWSWCGQFSLVRGTSREQAFVDLLRTHAGFLRTHLELDVGGNHLIKNLKALVGLGVFLSDNTLLDGALRRLRREVERQVLPDGGHFERAPAYHCQVLGDLVDLADLLSATGEDPPGWLAGARDRMRRFLGLVLLPDGTVPLLNDGYPVPADVVSALDPGPAAGEGITVLPDTGLAVLRNGPLFVLADIGDPCPDELPAHAHADTLSFLLYDDGRPVVVELHTSTYAPGRRRALERGTRGHSTVEVDGSDSTEVWGAFRAGHRARVKAVTYGEDGDAAVLSAEHDGYRRLPGSPVHRRTWRLSRDRLTVRDEIDGVGRHEVVVRVVLAPGVGPGDATRFGGGWRTEPAEVAEGWDRRRECQVLTRGGPVRLPWVHEFHYDRSIAR